MGRGARGSYVHSLRLFVRRYAYERCSLIDVKQNKEKRLLAAGCLAVLESVLSEGCMNNDKCSTWALDALLIYGRLSIDSKTTITQQLNEYACFLLHFAAPEHG